MMTISQIMEKMIAFSVGNIHDIDHLIRVWTYAKTIGELEGLDADTCFLLEVAAITHDIACPLCREKYGNTNGKFQETEGSTMVISFLSDTGMTDEQISRVAYLVGHHHTYHDIDGIDYQILLYDEDHEDRERETVAPGGVSGSGENKRRFKVSMIHNTKTAESILREIQTPLSSEKTGKAGTKE